ncbi:hypothetical protein KW783_02260 [Candidatus Parcubacteria bacterium]|nr:hypothetical protein [Candidatus Parcubacteria bacterium]
MSKQYRQILVLACFFTIAVFFVAKPLYAQVRPNVNLIVTPQSVAPNQHVTFSIESFSFDINSATVSWFINGKLIKKAVGEKTFNVTVGKAGTATTVLAHIVAPGGIVVDKTVTLRPNTVNLIWQAKTYTPPFYKGKALFTYQSDVEFSALATIIGKNGVRVSPQNLIYTWSVNGDVQADKSGYGKNTIMISSPLIPRPIYVQVDVTTQDKSIHSSADVTIAPLAPQVVFYENHPLYGTVYEHALPDSVHLIATEIKIAAIPYFFAGSPKDLTFTWLVNNKQTVASERNSLVLRNNSGTGVSLISLSIQNVQKTLQAARSTFSIQF